jgi:hypothetical protein
MTYRQGWQDRMRGYRIDYSKYDRWDAQRQTDYEQGRRDAACAQSKNHNKRTPPASTLVLPVEVQLLIASEHCIKRNPR